MTGESGAGRYLGVVVGGSMSRGVDVRLSPDCPVEDVAMGQHVVIQGRSRRFFGVVTDVSLEWSDDSVRANPPDTSNPLIAGVAAGTAAYASLRVLPMLAIAGELAALEGPAPARTVPPHFAPVRLASEEDVQVVFGAEDNRHFWVGSPLDMETRVCLDLDEFVKRSNGVFGKSGTGKSFLTRLLLAGILQKSAAVNLVFDMESEYGWMGTSEGTGMVKGIKQLFPSRVAVFSLDDEHSRRRGVSPDYLLRVGYNQIEPEDIELLRENLGLSEVAADAAYSLARHFGQERWVKRFLELEGHEMRDVASELNVNERAMSTLHNRLSRFRRYGFITERESDESVEEILRYLDRGNHVVLGVRAVQARVVGVHAGRQPADAPDPRPLRAAQGGGNGRRRAGAAPARHHHRGGAPVPQPRGCVPRPRLATSRGRCGSTTSRCSSSTSGPAASTRR